MTWDAVVSRIAHDSCVELPSMMPEQEWWSRLEADFHHRDEGFDLALGDKWRVQATALFDVAVRTIAAASVSALAMPLGFHPLEMRRVLRDRALYARPAERGDPSLFFRDPPRGVEVKSRRLRFGHFHPAGGECLDLRFKSPYVPYNARMVGRLKRRKRNSIAHARYWRHLDGPRPTVAAIHGFGAEAYWLNEWFFALPVLYAMGYDVMLFILPFHGPRQSVFSPFSGHGFFSGGVAGINEAFGQAIYDFRIFMNHLEETYGCTQLGVTGISLGGFTTALLAATEERLAFAVPNVPVISLADLVMEWHPASYAVKSVLGLTGTTIAEARHLLACSCPLTYPAKLPRERLMVIGGVGDRMAPPKHARLLWDHWRRPRLHWFPGSHLIHLDKGEYVREMARFFKSIDF